MPGARSWMTLWTSFQPILQNLDTHHTRTSQNSPTKVVLDMEYKKMCTGVFCFWGLVPPPNLQFLCIYSMCHLSYIRWNKRYSSFIWLLPVDGVISVKNFVRHKHTHTHKRNRHGCLYSSLFNSSGWNKPYPKYRISRKLPFKFISVRNSLQVVCAY